MKQELQQTGHSDVRTVRLFTGTKNSCSVNIADNLFYDCCFDMDGLANKIKLSKCTAEELSLAKSRRKGLCHYIGVKTEKVLGLWVSRKEHLFCVFPTKLSKVFQPTFR
jgi:conjugal transfer mating pair stabilization protein TraN